MCYTKEAGMMGQIHALVFSQDRQINKKINLDIDQLNEA